MINEKSLIIIEQVLLHVTEVLQTVKRLLATYLIENGSTPVNFDIYWYFTDLKLKMKQKNLEKMKSGLQLSNNLLLEMQKDVLKQHQNKTKLIKLLTRKI